VSKLYDTCQEVIRIIDSRGLDPFKTRGALAMKVGFLVTAVRPDDPDDPAKVQRLKDAAQETLGVTLAG
jgi:hypothetical protein